MEFEELEPRGLVLIRPKVFTDERGYFFESYNEEKFRAAGIDAVFVQDNQSLSAKNILRGLHYQHPPYEQGKLVRVIRGSVLDIVVDIRRESPTYGKHAAVELSASNTFMLWIPPGFAHGFLSLEDETLFLYKCTNVYHKNSESGIIWNDAQLGINWHIKDPKVSEKDQELPAFSNIDSRF